VFLVRVVTDYGCSKNYRIERPKAIAKWYESTRKISRQVLIAADDK